VTGWHLGPLSAFDIESGGTNVEEHRIVTITACSIVPQDSGRPKVDTWNGLIAVDVDIDPDATEVHGITTEFARENGKPAAEVLDEAAGLLALSLHRQVPVCGMNLSFDWTILDRECRRWGVPTVEDRLDGQPFSPVIDVLVLDKALDRYRPGKRKLTDLAALYGVRHDGAHDAVEDALAAARIAYRMGARSHLPFDQIRALYADRRFPDRIARDWQAMSKLTLPELHDRQRQWYAEQSESLGVYWARKQEGLRADALDPSKTDEERAIAVQEADELEASIASLSSHWPVKPLVVSP
jgi:DNA polymerase-3 subunit epsilon